jgi:TRAP-type uncharacterized transport system substrate-binding protein
VDLALLQSDTLSLPDIAVVAPLYYEAVHILVKSDLGVKSLADLRHRRMMLGSEKSGARRVARLLFQRAGMDLNDFVIDQGEWHGLLTQPSADACIVVTKKGASDLVAVLATGHYCLLPVADSLQFALDEPIFHPVLLDIDSYPNCNLPPDGIASIAITAFLACRVDAPPILIQTVLENLFLPDFVRENGILAAEWASRWPGSTWHPAAREFFQAYHGSPVHPR